MNISSPDIPLYLTLTNFHCYSSWVDPPEDTQLLQQLSQMLHALKNHNTSGWNALLAVTDRDVRHHTLDTFRV